VTKRIVPQPEHGTTLIEIEQAVTEMSCGSTGLPRAAINCRKI
jgi:hypothetical protein